MEWKIQGSPAFARLEVVLNPGEELISEADAMISMDSFVDLKATFNGGLFRGLLRKYLGKESLFISRYTNNTDKSSSLVLSQSWPGDIFGLQLNGNTVYLQPGSFLACTPGIKLGLAYAGIASFIGREGLFKLEVSGTGFVWFGSFGGIQEKQVAGDYIVDSSHLVAYEPGINLKVRMAGGILSSLFGGEGLVTRLEGNGKVWLQSRSPTGMSAFLNPRL